MLGSLETPDPPGWMDDLVYQDLRVQREIPGCQVSQVPLGFQGQRATWERWDSQVPLELKEPQGSPADPGHLAHRVLLGSPAPKVNLEYQDLECQEALAPRVTRAYLEPLESLDLKVSLVHQGCQVYLVAKD